MEKIILKECPKHGITEYALKKDGRYRCKKCAIEAVQKRREEVKKLLVEKKGGKCEICGYNKCITALEFHHLNPKEKEFGIGAKGYTRSLESNVNEINKCILVCANCHREIHEGLIDVKNFDIKKIEYNDKIKDKKDINKKEQNIKAKGITKEKILETFKEFKNFTQSAKQFNISDNALRKWCKKFGLPIKTKEMLEFIS